MFENITAAPADPILGLADLFRADERPGKINLGIGVYKDETGKTRTSNRHRPKRGYSELPDTSGFQSLE